MPITIALFVVVLASLVFARNGTVIHSIGAFWCRIVLALTGVGVEIKGAENIPDGPIILASNHQGVYDIPVLQGYLPLQFRWVAKESLFKIPIIGWTMKFAGYVSINRERASAAFKSMAVAAKKVKGGTSVLIFPEGTRSREGGLLPFKRGVFFIATKSGVPLVPISIDGTTNIMKAGALSVRPARVKVSIGEPISTEGVTEAELMEKTREAIEKGFKD